MIICKLFIINCLPIHCQTSLCGEENTGIKRASVALSLRLINDGMIWLKKDREKERYYLFAGMGGKAMRRKNKKFLAWSIFAAAVVSLALALFLLNFD